MNPYYVHAIQPLYAMARQMLVDEGHVPLGALLNAARKGTSKVKFGRLMQRYWRFFRGVSDQELQNVYELLLLHLERAHGPLLCSSHDNQLWGYAERRFEGCPQPHGNRAPSLEARGRALQEGHPDSKKARRSTLPSTSWRRTAVQLRRAA